MDIGDVAAVRLPGGGFGACQINAPPDVDLSGTGLTGLSIGRTVELLRLPDGLTSLGLPEDAHVTTVTAAGRGRWLRLGMACSQVPAGLDEVRDLRRVGRGTISAGPLSDLRHLETLWLSWNSAPGSLTDAAALGRLSGLAALTVHGLCRSAARAIKARYRRTGVRLTVTGAKDDTWLAANLTNPLRDWADDDPRGGAAACKAYATAVRAIDAGDAAAETILRTFVDHLNHIDARYGFVDTVRREEAGEAFDVLAGRAGVGAGTAEEWFDEWRDF